MPLKWARVQLARSRQHFPAVLNTIVKACIIQQSDKKTAHHPINRLGTFLPNMTFTLHISSRDRHSAPEPEASVPLSPLSSSPLMLSSSELHRTSTVQTTAVVPYAAHLNSPSAAFSIASFAQNNFTPSNFDPT
jgi:hypothetical protein